MTTRYLGSTVGVSEERLVFDQQELRRNVALVSDLYSYDWSTKQVRALTRPVGQELGDRILGDRILHGFLLRSAGTGAGVRCAHAGSVVSESPCINA